ncbi:MAG: pyridoxamine 5-phosphate oxidase-related FMN-binding protein [Chloroflexi bacterium]|jgi:PPOX class probable F420-dependent enzyme|nr:pyridoxamine 5-phosphate oxidase-related FMN-binding protein [Chloroflexota bacterium]
MTTLTPEQRKLFEDPNLVNVATLGKDGTPRSTAIWVDLDGDDILLNGATSRQWVENLRRDPHVALNVFDLKNPYTQVNVLGEVVEITQEGGEEHIDKLSQKYFGKLYPDHRAEDPRVIARVKINKVIGR